MSPKHPAGPRCSVLGLLMAMLALLGQIALGPIMPAVSAPLDAALLGDVPICHSGASDSTGGGAPAEHGPHGMQCALCPACHALAAAAFLPVLTPQPPTPLTPLIAHRAPSPPARAPPVVTVHAAAYPTGPPSLA